jgi:hypothetical protein
MPANDFRRIALGMEGAVDVTFCLTSSPHLAPGFFETLPRFPTFCTTHRAYPRPGPSE